MPEMKRRKFLQHSVATAAATIFTPTLSAQIFNQDIENVTRRPVFPRLTMQQAGTFVEAEVPDTLDLAERAGLAINGLTGSLDSEQQYEVYQLQIPAESPAYFSHESTGLGTINPKYAEALPMMRVICGSEQNLGHERGMMHVILSRIKPPGLYFVPPGTETFRPWVDAKRFPGAASERTANIYGNARLLLACMAWVQVTGDPVWEKIGNKLTNGLAMVAVYKDDYAYYPHADGGKGEPFTYPESGWVDEKEPMLDDKVGGESLFMVTGGQARALACWAGMSGNEKARDLSGQICKFIMKPKFWGIDGSWGECQDALGGRTVSDDDPATVLEPEHGLWQGHTAGRLEALRGLIEYAILTDNTQIKEFVRSSYTSMRNHGFVRVGFFPAVPTMVAGGAACGASRAIALAIKLTESGIADYWEDIDQFVRNMLVATQRLPQDFSEQQLASSASAPPLPDDFKAKGFQIPGGQEGAESIPTGSYTTDHVVQRCIGGFGHGCCNSNGGTGLYYAWEAAVRYTDPNATVNLLLNRASPWVDVDSYLPFEGKVVLHNKTAQNLSVRIPVWVPQRDIRCRVNNNETTPSWKERYLVFGGLASGDKVTITFPMVTETTVYTILGNKVSCTFKGNTLVEIEPEGFGFRTALRDEYKKDRAPMKRVTRYVHPTVLEW